MRVAVVGSGPSGIYAADALVSQDAVPVEVDIIDRLPVPFGLVRYGVAPDHLSIRSVRDTLDKTLDKPGVRFLGNVTIGSPADGGDLSVADLHDHYDAVVFTYGASRDRRLGIDGEDLDGSVAATDFVAWYCGHPDADRATFERLIPHQHGGRRRRRRQRRRRRGAGARRSRWPSWTTPTCRSTCSTPWPGPGSRTSTCWAVAAPRRPPGRRRSSRSSASWPTRTWSSGPRTPSSTRPVPHSRRRTGPWAATSRSSASGRSACPRASRAGCTCASCRARSS